MAHGTIAMVTLDGNGVPCHVEVKMDSGSRNRHGDIITEFICSCNRVRVRASSSWVLNALCNVCRQRRKHEHA